MKKTLFVEGMDCISCETVLRDALEAVPTIKVLSLTHKTGKMTIEYSSEEDLKVLESILKQHNYSLREENTVPSSEQSLTDQIAIGVGILTILWALTRLDLMQYLGNYGPNM
jgi:cation transport ATPase